VAAPLLGEHTTEVLKEVGYLPERISALGQGGAITEP
jgi:crotonobetainyl-CoA:carnitine CoA-transferase CaiB-like acyl-CoA transferase